MSKTLNHNKFKFFGQEKAKKPLVILSLSVRLYGTTCLSLGALSKTFILATLAKISRPNSTFVKSDKTVRHLTARPTSIYENISLNYSWFGKCFRKFEKKIDTHFISNMVSNKRSLYKTSYLQGTGRVREAKDDLTITYCNTGALFFAGIKVKSKNAITYLVFNLLYFINPVKSRLGPRNVKIG
jgi:hypothetical protein